MAWAHRFRTVWGVPATAVLSVALIHISTAAAQEATPATVEPHVFEAYSGDTVHAELGRFRVPLNRGRNNTDSLELAFLRFPAVGPEPGPPIVYLAGGPGGSGIATARGSRFPLFMAFRRFGDVIAFDQRGTGMSEGPSPEECESTRSYPVGRPLYADHHRKLLLDVARACAELWRREGVDLEAYNTRESADDVAALADALGAERLRLWGISYGTHLGLAILRRHPQLVERAILAGIEGPDHTVKLPAYWTAQLEKLDRLIDRDTAVGRELPDLGSTIERVLRRLEGDPAPVELISGDLRDTVRSRVTRYEVELATIDRLRDPETLVTVPFLYRRMAAGDFSVVAGPAPEIGGFEAMPEAMDAASGISEERLFRLLRENESHLLGAGDALANAYMGSALGIRVLGEPFRAPIRSEVPTLFISGTLDGRTPLENALEVLDGFPNGRHLVIENAGHSDDLFLSSPEIQAVMEAFLADRPLPTTRIRVRPPDLASGRLPPALPAALVDRIVGAYQRADGDVWRVVRRGIVRSLDADGAEAGRRDALSVRIRGNGFPFAARSDTTFYIPYFGPDLVFRFLRDLSGQLTRMELIRSPEDTTRFEPVAWDSIGFLDSGRWWIAGPFGPEPDVSSACERRFAPEEDALDGALDMEDRYMTAAGQVGWRPARGDDGFVNFEETLGGAIAGGVGYAYLAVIADRPRQAWIRVGTDDDARVYLNGDRIYAYDGAREAWETQDTIPVRFPAARSQLLVKVCNRDSDWRFNLRITDAEGRSLVRQSDERGVVRLRPAR